LIRVSDQVPIFKNENAVLVDDIGFFTSGMASPFFAYFLAIQLTITQINLEQIINALL